jgi:hypothetical protein
MSVLTFFKGIITNSDGNTSSKRTIMFLLTLLFISQHLYCLFSGKAPNAILGEQLFYLLGYTFTLVFGEGVVKDITGMKKEIGISKNENK